VWLGDLSASTKKIRCCDEPFFNEVPEHPGISLAELLAFHNDDAILQAVRESRRFYMSQGQRGVPAWLTALGEPRRIGNDLPRMYGQQPFMMGAYSEVIRASDTNMCGTPENYFNTLFRRAVVTPTPPTLPPAVLAPITEAHGTGKDDEVQLVAGLLTRTLTIEDTPSPPRSRSAATYLPGKDGGNPLQGVDTVLLDLDSAIIRPSKLDSSPQEWC